MALAEQILLLLLGFLPLFALTALGGWWWMYLAEWRHRPTHSEVGHVPAATFRVGVRIGKFAWSLPLARVSTYEGFVVVKAFASTPIVLHRSDRVRVHKTRPIAMLGMEAIELQPARRPGFLLRITPRTRDAIALESALRRSLDSVSAGSS